MFDPIQASEEIKNSYIDYITTSFDMADKVYADLFRKELRREGMAARGPYLDIGGSYMTGRTLRELMGAGTVSPLFADLEPGPEKERELKLERPLYRHQEQALVKASKGQNLVVTTGTGSGKTESFLLPILHHILTQVERGELDSGVRAIIIYPMNALANDQMKRMRALLKHYSRIRFGIYVGNTEHQYKKALEKYRRNHTDGRGNTQDPLPNELISREEMQKEPPHILITNYSMLEYMMLRPKDDAVFTGAKLKYIVLDEAHIYKGATGIETSLLMRRLRARISEPDAVQYILTSATLGGPGADGEIVSFAEKLTGVGFRTDGIIRSVEKNPDMLEYRDIDPQIFSKLSNATPDSVGLILQQNGLDFCPEGTAGEKLYQLCLRLRLFAALRQAVTKPVTVTQLLDILSKVSPSLTRTQVVEFISVCSKAEWDGASLIKPRYHFFVRALEGAYINLTAPKRLFLQRKTELSLQDGRSQAIFEAAVCNDCGRMAIAGKVSEANILKHFARQGESDETEYYLLKDSKDVDFFDGEDQTDDADDGSHDYAICPICGAIATEADLRFEVPCSHAASDFVKVRLAEKTATGKAKCPACGFGSFRRFFLGSEAATAVLGTALFEQLPEEKVVEDVLPEQPAKGLFARRKNKKVTRTELTRQFLCFSDSRSEAAFFATYMERSYQVFLRRRGIWHVAEQMSSQGKSRMSVNEFVGALAHYYEVNRCFAEYNSGRDGLSVISQRNAWIAVLNEMFNARRSTSLSTLGVIAFSYQKNDDDLVEGFANQYHISPDYASALLEQLTQDAVFSGALTAGKRQSLTNADREDIFFSQYEKKLVKVKDESYSDKSNFTGWAGRKRPNGNFFPNSRIARLVRALGISEQDADDFLGEYWKYIFEPEGETFTLDANDFDILLGGTDAVRFYRCQKCGKITPFNAMGHCISVKCSGKLTPYEPLEHLQDNHYAKLYQSKQMKPLFIKEHTAQLSRDQQTAYQEAFVHQQINALSCSTTFEMGVDLGSLETVYLRDVPPSPSNYVQRAGRAGRGKGSAAFVMTYAKLSSHDFTYYSEPERMISGKISAPVFELENEIILYRHIYAVAFGAFLSQNEDVYDADNRTILLNEGGYERLVTFLEAKPPELKRLLMDSIPRVMHKRLGLEDWSWVEHLCGADGTLQVAVDDFRNTVSTFEKNIKAERDIEERAKWNRALRLFRCSDDDKCGKRSLIDFLVRSNVLPKYGFPVDTVELQTSVKTFDDNKQLQLARDLQMAIADYAPGAQVVADGKLYTSRYIRKSTGANKGHSWETGYYCPKCPSCGQPNFTKEKFRGSRECVSCKKPIPKLRWKQTLEPRLGFGIDVDHREEAVPMTRPKHDYKTDDYYIGDPFRNILQEQVFYVNNRTLKVASTSNDSLVVVGQTEFDVCPACGYASKDGIPLKHKNMRGFECVNREGNKSRYRLSHDFKTDVAQIAFVDSAASEMDTMLSVMYALLEGLSREMEIERTDIKGCLFRTFEDGHLIYSVILYDAVAGGAGHVRRMVTEDGAAFQRILRRAYAVVNQCDCGISCYKCLRNYYNQKIHDQLDRTKAADFLREWIGNMVNQNTIDQTSEQTSIVTIELGDDMGMNMRDMDWESIWDTVAAELLSPEEKTVFANLRTLPALFHGREKPCFDHYFTVDGNEYEFTLLWPQSKVMLFTSEYEESYLVARKSDWTCFSTNGGALVPKQLAQALKEV